MLHNLHINIVFVSIYSIIFMLHNLHIIDHANRLCTICTDAEIGDEFHYILQWEYWANERKFYLSQYFSHIINTLKFGQLFQIKDKPKPTKLCKFICVLQYHIVCVLIHSNVFMLHN